MNKERKPLKVRHVTIDFPTGKKVVREESFGEKPTVIKHRTRIEGVPTTVTRENKTEVESKTEGLR